MDNSAATAAPREMTPEEEEAMKILAEAEGQKLVSKIKYLGFQMDTMDEKEKIKYSNHFDQLSKSMGKLRRMIRKKMPDNSWQWTVYICVAVLILIYVFFGYKLYKSLVERDRKREEKLKAKQSKKKK